MQFEVCMAADMTAERISAWGALQSSHADLWSPFFRPEFTLAVAAVRRDVEVAILHKDDRPIGFFPYQRSGKRNVATPVGGWLSDYQAVVGAPDIQWDPPQLLEACRLQAWNFTNLLASQHPWAKFHCRQSDSAIWNLTAEHGSPGGHQDRNGKEWHAQHQRKARKANREVGTMRLVFNEPATSLTTLLDWKRRQYQMTGVVDRLRPAWTSDLLAQVMQSCSTEFSGTLSAIYFGDRVAAMLLGLRCRDVLHYWLPAYDVELSQYSPGSLLLLELARSASELGLRIIDFGHGDEPYKARFVNGAVKVASGFVDRRPLNRSLKAAYWGARNWVSRSTLRGPVKAFVHHLTPMYDRFSRGPRERIV